MRITTGRSIRRPERDKVPCRDQIVIGLELEELGIKLDEAFSPRILLLLGLSS
ncbi:hypothetical protein Taro_003063, partial [Colocasia esculenta]|nr:hypothetical protein [Colocasia esculenta]